VRVTARRNTGKRRRGRCTASRAVVGGALVDLRPAVRACPARWARARFGAATSTRAGIPGARVRRAHGAVGDSLPAPGLIRQLDAYLGRKAYEAVGGCVALNRVVPKTRRPRTVTRTGR